MYYRKKTIVDLKNKKFWLSIIFIVGVLPVGCGESEPEAITQTHQEDERGNSVGNINNKGIAARQGDWIYYQNDDDVGNVYKIKADGNGREIVQ